jgi:hypothetical protein
MKLHLALDQKIRGEIYPEPVAKSDEEFVTLVCAAPPTPSVTEACRLFTSDVKDLAWRIWKGWAFWSAVVVVSYLSVRLLWLLLDWVILGFQRQASAPPPSS